MEKQLGPTTEYPEDPNTPKRFVVQAHYRGMSVHLDFRFARNSVAEGWTVAAQVEGAIKTPVVTLEQGRKIAKDQSVWKFDLDTGYIFPREVKTTIRGEKRTVIRPGSLYAERKAQLIPIEWLDVEGRTEFPPDWPKTVIEYWDKWPKEVQEKLRKEGWDPKKAEQVINEGSWKVDRIPVGATRSFPGVFVMIDKGYWVPGARKPYFFEYFLEGNELFPPKVVFRFVARAKSMREAVELAKAGAIVLPPGEAEETIREPGYWLFVTPDPTPYVLSDEAVEKDWLPPVGVAALPSWLRESVPPELKFWEEKDEERRKAMREELAAWYEEGNFKSQTKEKPRFKLFRQTFRGQIVIRFGPSTTIYYLLLNDPKMVFSLDNDPRLREEVAGVELDEDYYRALYTKTGVFEPQPGTLLNPTKETPSRIELIDEGEATVLEEEPGLLRLKLEGREITGYYLILWESEDSPIVIVRRSDTPSALKGTPFIPVGKNEEKQIVYGVVLSPHEPDAQGDIISPDEVEKAAHRYLIFGRQVGINHQGEPILAFPVESFIARTSFYYDPSRPDSLVREGEWVLGVWIPEREVWEKIKNGELTGWSIQGLGIRHKLQESLD